MATDDHRLAVWEVQFSYYDSNRRYRPTGKRWVLAADVPTALRLIGEVVVKDGLAVHSVQKRSGDLYGEEKLVVDWDTLDALRGAHNATAAAAETADHTDSKAETS